MDENHDEYLKANIENSRDYEGLTKSDVSEVIRSELSNHESRLRREYEDALAIQKVNMDVLSARQTYSDFDSVSTEALGNIQKNDNLLRALESAPNKAEFLYQYGVRDRAYKQLLENQQAMQSRQEAQNPPVPEPQPQSYYNNQPQSLPFTSPASVGGYQSTPNYGAMSDEEFDKYCKGMGLE